MKRFFLIIAAALFVTLAINASPLSEAQKKAKVEIFNALKRYTTNLSESGEETFLFRYADSKYTVYSLDELN